MVFLLRIVVYITLAAAMLEFFVLLATHLDVPDHVFKEDGPLEWVEFSLVSVTAFILLLNARTHVHYTVVLYLCGLLAIFAAIRELDHFLDQLLFDGAYKLINGPILLLCGYLAWRHRRSLPGSIRDFSHTPSFCLFLAGTFLVVLFAQVLGQKEIWMALMGDGYTRSVKAAVEEISEILGYLIILCGAVETFFLSGQRASSNNKGAKSG